MSFGGGELEGINMKVGGEGGKEGVGKGRRKGVGKEGGRAEGREGGRMRGWKV